MDQTTISATIAAATLVAGEALKKLGMPSKFIPYANVVIAVVISIMAVVTNYTEGNTFQTIVSSLLSTLAAGGIYDLIKATFVSKKEDNEGSIDEGIEEIAEINEELIDEVEGTKEG